jgi:hypothetical protein
VSFSLFPDFADEVRTLSDSAVADPRTHAPLLLHRTGVGSRMVEMIYAPFDHINSAARIVIVGLTPGLQQARNALAAARTALRNGASIDGAAAEAKVYASFSGPMRNNLVRLLDHIGIARTLGIGSTAELWGRRSDLVHFTSALRYPVFIDGQNWSGQPDMLRVPDMRGWLERYSGQELQMVREALFVPLGPKVTAALDHLASAGLLGSARVLRGLPHPSGANAERISCFLGDKAAEFVSQKTNAASLYAARTNLMRQVAALG